MDIKLEEGLTDEMRVALHDLVQSATACEWCAERCIDEGPGMSECIRLCRDVADLATLNIQFISRDSVFGPEAIEVFASAAEACARECARHGHRHCQECAEQLSRAVQSVRKMLASFGQEGGQFQGAGMQPQGGQIGGQQPGSQGQQFSEAPGQQTQLPIQGGGGVQGQQGQPYQQPGAQQGQQPGSQQPGGQYAGEQQSQPYQGQSGTQGQPPGQQF